MAGQIPHSDAPQSLVKTAPTGVHALPQFLHVSGGDYCGLLGGIHGVDYGFISYAQWCLGVGCCFVCRSCTFDELCWFLFLSWQSGFRTLHAVFLFFLVFLILIWVSGSLDIWTACATKEMVAVFHVWLATGRSMRSLISWYRTGSLFLGGRSTD